MQSSCEHAETALRVKSLVESLQVIRTVAVGLGTYLHRHACCVDLCQWWLWCCLLGGGWVAPSHSSEHDGLLPGVQIASGKLHQAQLLIELRLPLIGRSLYSGGTDRMKTATQTAGAYLCGKGCVLSVSVGEEQTRRLLWAMAVLPRLASCNGLWRWNVC